MGSYMTLEPRVLFISNDPSAQEPFCRVLSLHQGTLIVAEGLSQAVWQLKSGLLPHFIFIDIRVSDVSGLDTLHNLREMLGGALPMAVMTTIKQTRTAVLAMQRGADAFLLAPFEDRDLELLLADLEKKSLAARPETQGSAGATGFISVNERMLQIKDIIRQIAGIDVPVLLQGESGVGKEVVTRYLHEQSERCHGPFIKVNCAALSADLIESELFGHEKGSFTGASTPSRGKFELAQGGILFLDEITELRLSIQAKLLHVLQDGRFFKVGGSKYLTTDARIVAATNRVLKDAVQAGHFREDLYFRLDVIDIYIPPLRERKEDIPLLCAYFIDKYAAAYRRRPCPLPAWILSLFQTYNWPGNVRELENIVRRLLVLPDEQMVLQDILIAVETPSRPAAPVGPLCPPSLKALQEQNRLTHSREERDIILKTLDVHKWNRKKAAAYLGISYKTLLNKLEKWDLRPPP